MLRVGPQSIHCPRSYDNESKNLAMSKTAPVPGRLIVMEGSDGSGKATQTRLLVNRLRAEGFEAERIGFPQYAKSFFGRMVGAYLRGEFGAASDVDPRLASLLYAADRFEARDRILDWLTEGKVVVCDRYVDSNKAHQALKVPKGRDRAAFLRWVDRMEHGVFGLPRPDCTVFLHVPHNVSEQLISAKGRRAYLKGKRRDVHEADPGHLQSAQQLYMEIAARRRAGDVEVIACCEEGRLLSRKAISERVWRAVRGRLPAR